MYKIHKVLLAGAAVMALGSGAARAQQYDPTAPYHRGNAAPLPPACQASPAQMIPIIGALVGAARRQRCAQQMEQQQEAQRAAQAREQAQAKADAQRQRRIAAKKKAEQTKKAEAAEKRLADDADPIVLFRLLAKKDGTMNIIPIAEYTSGKECEAHKAPWQRQVNYTEIHSLAPIGGAISIRCAPISVISAGGY
jgi:hypothetical protein